MKFDNKKIRDLLYKLASLEIEFSHLVDQNNIEDVQFKMIDNALFQNISFEPQGLLKPWEEQLENKFLFYFLYLNTKVYIYIWIDDRKQIIELEFMYICDYDDSLDFIGLALNNDIYLEYPVCPVPLSQ